ncbi:MAG TPA: hypothetical protein PKO07_20060 [Pseudomonadota bacterium]|nr:hypothetical protein [Pseudomonadota bacterium]
MSSKNFLKFNGRDSLVDLGKQPAHKVARDITIEAWIFPEAQQRTYTGIVSKIYDTGPVESGYGLLLSGEHGIMFGFKTTGADFQYPKTPAGSLKLGQWQHVAATYDGKTAVIYIDGEKLCTHSFAAAALHYEPEHNLYIGTYLDNDERYPFQGLIAEVRLFNVARPQEEIVRTLKHRLIGNEAGLVGYWPLDDGGITSDKSERKCHGLVQGGFWEPQSAPLTEGPAPAVTPISKPVWTPLQGACVDLSVGNNADGRLVALVRGSNNAPYLRCQATASTDKFLDYQGFDGAFKGRPVLAQHADGRLLIAVVAMNDTLFTRQQTAPSATTWTPWVSRDGGLQQIVPTNQADGRIVLFATGKDEQVWQILQTEGNSEKWSPWSALGGAVGGLPVVVRTAKGRIELFMRGKDGELWHTWQDTPNSPYYRPWHSLGGTIQGAVAVASHADGRYQIFARGKDDALWTLCQLQPSGAWGKWESLGKGDGLAATDPVAIANRENRIEVFVRGKDNAIWRLAQQEKNATKWSHWQSLGGDHRIHAVARNTDGRLTLFAIGAEGGLWHLMQRSATADW